MAIAASKGPVISRPAGTSAFEFVVLSSLRAAQLMKGCLPRVEPRHKKTQTAQLEVATGKVLRSDNGNGGTGAQIPTHPEQTRA